jgi:hypothetical protein
MLYRSTTSLSRYTSKRSGSSSQRCLADNRVSKCTMTRSLFGIDGAQDVTMSRRKRKVLSCGGQDLAELVSMQMSGTGRSFNAFCNALSISLRAECVKCGEVHRKTGVQWTGAGRERRFGCLVSSRSWLFLEAPAPRVHRQPMLWEHRSDRHILPGLSGEPDSGPQYRWVCCICLPFY